MMLRKKLANSVRAAFTLILLGAVMPAIAGDVVEPDHALTPGATIAGVTAADVCEHGYTARVRNVPASVKRKVFEEYGIDPARSAEFEVDHLISLELGGSNEIANLWPEPYNADMGARIKDKLENRLHRMVCAGEISLDEAQRAIAGDWEAAFQKYMAR